MDTVNMTRAEIEERVGRFDALQPMATLKGNDKVPLGARDVILARKLMPVVLEKTDSPFGNLAPIYGAAGMTMFISVCPPGQGPCLHAHVKTFETFVVLEGAFEFAVNDDGGEKVVLRQWDTFSCPPGVCRGFRNVHEGDSVLLTIITGGVHDRNDIALAPSVAEELAQYGPEVVPELEKIGLRFTAGIPEPEAARA
jgi:quercetin dioxygenase-like cupin family protein